MYFSKLLLILKYQIKLTKRNKDKAVQHILLETGWDLTLYMDIAALIIIALSAIAGFTRGFIRELFSIGIWIIAGIGAWFLSIFVSQKLKIFLYEKWSQEKVLGLFGQEAYLDIFLRIIAAIIVVVILLFILQIIFSIFANSFKIEILRPVDKVLGFAFGTFKALLLFGAIWYIIEDQMRVVQKNPENIIQNYAVEYNENSKVIPFIRVGKAFVAPFLNPLMAAISGGVDTLKERPSDPDEATNRAITPEINQQQVPNTQGANTELLEIIEN